MDTGQCSLTSVVFSGFTIIILGRVISLDCGSHCHHHHNRHHHYHHNHHHHHHHHIDQGHLNQMGIVGLLPNHWSPLARSNHSHASWNIYLKIIFFDKYFLQYTHKIYPNHWSTLARSNHSHASLKTYSQNMFANYSDKYSQKIYLNRWSWQFKSLSISRLKINLSVFAIFSFKNRSPKHIFLCELFC